MQDYVNYLYIVTAQSTNRIAQSANFLKVLRSVASRPPIRLRYLRYLGTDRGDGKTACRIATN